MRMKFTLQIPDILQYRALLEAMRDLLRDMLTFYALLGLLLAVSKLFMPPTSIPDWLFLVSEAVCSLILLLWVSFITASNIKRLEAIFMTPRQRLLGNVLVSFSVMMLILAIWAAVVIAQK